MPAYQAMGGVAAQPFYGGVRWLQFHLAAALKVCLSLCSVASTKLGAVNAGALMPPSGYAERQQWIIYPLRSEHLLFSQMHETSRKRVGVTLTASQARCLLRVENRESLISYSRWESDFPLC